MRSSRARERLAAVTARLYPVVCQWDRLSTTWCYMLLLGGPVKVDLIFAEPHAALPPWRVTADTMPGIDAHFWDWMLWLTPKQQAGKSDLVAAELAKLHQHLLAPLGVPARAATLGQALTSYRTCPPLLQTAAAPPGISRRRADCQPGAAIGGPASRHPVQRQEHTETARVDGPFPPMESMSRCQKGGYRMSALRP